MGFSHDKIFRLILLAAAVLTTPLLRADSNSGAAATLQDLILPNYKGTELQYVLYGERAVNLGATITIYNPLIDIVSRNLPDVEVITLLKNVKSPDPGVMKITKLDPQRIYPIKTDYKLVKEFWAKVPHSQALISSTSAVYDKNKKTVTGEGYAHLRTRDLDIDGVGFDANQRTKFVHIRSKVSAVFRPGAGKLKDEAEILLAERHLKLLSSEAILGKAKKSIEKKEIKNYKVEKNGMIRATIRNEAGNVFNVEVLGYPLGACKAKCSCGRDIDKFCQHAVAACLYIQEFKQKNKEKQMRQNREQNKAKKKNIK